MSYCDDCNTEILLYLDNALSGQKLDNLRAHLADCSHCRERMEEELALSSLLHETRPLYVAPQGLRARVAAAAKQAAGSAPSTDHGRRASDQKSTKWLRHVTRANLSWKLLAGMILVLVLGLVLIPSAVQRVRARDYVEAATEIHRSYLNGTLPLECLSRTPEVVTDWFAGKTTFDFQLPTSESVPKGKPVYWLTGARLVRYKGNPAALVAYETSTEKISLLVASAKSVVVAGGEEVRSGNLAFHYRREASFEVITWSNHGLAYALVSSSVGSPQHSCFVCHQNMADQNLVKE